VLLRHGGVDERLLRLGLFELSLRLTWLALIIKSTSRAVDIMFPSPVPRLPSFGSLE
jgi:hypothetical protein